MTNLSADIPQKLFDLDQEQAYLDAAATVAELVLSKADWPSDSLRDAIMRQVRLVDAIALFRIARAEYRGVAE